MISLKQFWKKLKNLVSIANPSSELNSSDELGRYLTSSGWFAKSKNRVKHNAFMPNSEGELSVFNLTQKTEQERVQIPQKHILPKMPKGRSIYGYAGNVAKDFKKIKLEIVKVVPPPDHFNIENWPQSKDEQMYIAEELAYNASLNLFNNKITK